MIRWSYRQENLWTYKLNIEDEHGNAIYKEWEVSSPTMSIILELLSDYMFALDINKDDKVFDIEGLGPEDQMDVKIASIHKLEDADND
ncbi:MAG: hypothetical protein ACOC5T_08625 [Elusimicrobiota bacterium]